MPERNVMLIISLRKASKFGEKLRFFLITFKNFVFVEISKVIRCNIIILNYIHIYNNSTKRNF